MSRDSVAVLPPLPEPQGDMKWTREAGICINPEPGFTGEQMQEYAQAAIAALTREAAPQASGYAAVGWVTKRDLDQQLPARGHASIGLQDTGDDVQVFVLATTDSAIQSQQGATGGAVLREIAAEIRQSLGNGATVSTRRRWAIELEQLAALAHPQAAGSVASGAGDLSMSMFASRADYEAAAGSAPETRFIDGMGWVVPCKDAAHYVAYIRRLATTDSAQAQGERNKQLAAAAAATAPRPADAHDWRGDGEHCKKCGDPDWCASPACTPHPQAAGSAPGEALSMSMFASRADYEAAAGSAPVGVDEIEQAAIESAKDAARYRWLRHKITCGHMATDEQAAVIDSSSPDQLDSAIDAALGKERAE